MNDLRTTFNACALALLCTAAGFSQVVNGSIVGTITETSCWAVCQCPRQVATA